MHHTQYSRQYVPSLIPTTRLTPPITPPPKPSVCFSESTVFHGLSPPPISFHSLLLSLTQCLCYSLCSTSKWNHMIIDSLCLTYFTQYDLLWSCPCWYKSWIFILSDGGIILHCICGAYLLYPFIRWRASWFFPQFGNCGHCCCAHWGTDGPSFHYICIFGVKIQ